MLLPELPNQNQNQNQSHTHTKKEGHCEQDGSLGGRAVGLGREELGRLKWGVGKMIAHAPVTPVVIPLFHTGMAELIPINPFTRKILRAVPGMGNTVTARVGAEIRCGSVVFSSCLFVFCVLSVKSAVVVVVGALSCVFMCVSACVFQSLARLHMCRFRCRFGRFLSRGIMVYESSSLCADSLLLELLLLDRYAACRSVLGLVGVKTIRPLCDICRTLKNRFDDLLEDHERRHGPLRKLTLPSAPSPPPPPPTTTSTSSATGADGRERSGEEGGEAASPSSSSRGGGGGEAKAAAAIPGGREGDIVWKSTPEERQLYSRIARRVEDALLRLEVEARRDLGDRYPGLPAEAAAMLKAKAKADERSAEKGGAR